MMSGIGTLNQKLGAGETVVLDGGIGSELERLGVPMDDAMWCGLAMDAHPEKVANVHRQYLDAGVDIITANTYATPPLILRESGHGDKVEPWNRHACEIALAERDQHPHGAHAAVAGSVSTYGSWGLYDADTLYPSFAEQARILTDCGVDLLLLETLASPPDVVVAALEATSQVAIPRWLAISVLEDRDTGELMHGVCESRDSKETTRTFVTLSKCMDAIKDHPFDALLIMHSEFVIAEKAVRFVADRCSIPVGVYPNAGYWQRPSWVFKDQVSPEEYARASQRWVSAGAAIVGGCCGVGPSHISAVVRKLFNNAS